MRSRLFFAAVTAALAFVNVAHAGDPPEESAKRVLPDYDGRGPDPSNTDGAGTWLARILLSPLYFTSEFLLRRPLGALIKGIEGSHLPKELYDFFAFGPNHKIGFAPVGLVEFGFNPSIGIFGFWDDALVKRNSFRLHYEAWPDDWLYGGLTDRYAIDSKRTVQVRVAGLHRPDFVFYGLGPRSLQSSQSRYAMSLFDASATLEARAWRSSAVHGTIGLRKVDVSDGHFGGDPSVTVESAREPPGAFPIPYGFDREYVAPYTSLLAVLDTRKPNGSATGVKLEIDGEQGSNVATRQFSGWVRYGATATAFVDLNQHGRVLSIKIGALFSDPLGTQPVPFTELISLGGLKWMPGYFPNRLVDRSAAVATLAYAWPIAPKLNATMQASVGNVFGEHLDDFSLNLLRISGALGMTTTLTGEAPVRFLIGFGSETIEHGMQIDSFCLSFGVPRSF